MEGVEKYLIGVVPRCCPGYNTRSTTVGDPWLPDDLSIP
jgi:hypothetical protein